MRGLIEFFSTALGHMYVMRLDQIACLEPYQHLILTLRGERIYVVEEDWPRVESAFRAAYGEPPAADQPPAESDNAVLSRSIEELELSTRAYNCLTIRSEIRTIGDLVQRTEKDLLRIRNFGRVSLKEIRDILATMNLTFGMKVNQ